MLICQHHATLQPATDLDETVDWTHSAQLYGSLDEIPSFISNQRQIFTQQSFNSNADFTLLQGKQLQAYQSVLQHYQNGAQPPLRMIISGTAGTGKSFLINCLKLLLLENLRVCAPTGVASYNIGGSTLHSLFSLPTKGDFKDLEGRKLHDMQQSLAQMKYLIIDEMSMIGRKIFGQIDRRLRQIFPQNAHELLGGCSCILLGDFGQLPPVMDLPIYTTAPRNELSDLGSSTYHSFDCAIVLDQVMRQSGQSPEQVLFRNILLRLRNANSTISDWNYLMQQTALSLHDVALFDNAVRLFPTVQSVAEYNIDKLHSINRPVATIKAVHSGTNASKASSEDASGLDPTVHLAHGARVMLTTNLWVEVGLVNGALGSVVCICYKEGGPPALPIAVMVKFDKYTGPTLFDGTIPITPIRRTWSSSGTQCSRLQIPLKLAWAMTIHKAQGLTLDKVVVDVGKKEFSCGLTYVACSRVRCLKDLLFIPPFPYSRLSNLSKSQRLQERLIEDDRLQSIYESQLLSPAFTDQTYTNVVNHQSLSMPSIYDHHDPTSSVLPTHHQHDLTPSPPSIHHHDHQPSSPSRDYERIDRQTPSPLASPCELSHTSTPSPCELSSNASTLSSSQLL